MAGNNTFGGTIKLEGEKAYRQAITQINSNLKVLAIETDKKIPTLRLSYYNSIVAGQI